MSRSFRLSGLLPGAWVVCLAATSGWCLPTMSVDHDAASGQIVLTLTDELPALDLREEDGWTRLTPLSAGTCRLEESDRPQLPGLEYWISVPADAAVLTVTAEGVRREMWLALPPLPAPRPAIPQPEHALPPPVADPRIYGSLGEFPERFYDQRIQAMGSGQVLIVRFYPFRYVGSRQTLVRYEKPRLTVRLSCTAWRPQPQPVNAMDREVQRRLADPSQAFFQPPGKQ